MSLLAARALSKTYHSRALLGPARARSALSDASLSIAEGETLALLGRSGCGKSTLARLLSGLEAPSTGEVLFEGTALPDLDRTARARMRAAVQMVFQDSPSATNPRFTVGRIIAEPLRHLTPLDRTGRRARVAELLEQVELPPEMAAMRPSQLSGGQLQRVCIARALAPRPRLVILDEAVSNLDIHLQASALALLRRLRRETGMAFLFVTHDLRLVRRFADRVLVMDEGRIVEEAASGRLETLMHPASVRLRTAILPPFPPPREVEDRARNVG
ncbi:nickel import ATP-binding protein NikE [Pseudooceanicola sp. CBS1P-1]|uniref:Nickel import ATP-binding protein NikE n=1 Tax=Pseudooceanicola albus TaxID=2692189 RepID=A0A6L7G460_9RHOB|nr:MULTISPECIES: nickel import ATP-binding protein NikE [Pseudooceanicola]MBT9383578.1 nickel import ATP-binding protein NikE [Pseudooceanicola endophyticus]MXN17433.1 nickel import ATP-binding protein NikE [Pseudooceanicola albus]